MWHFARIVYIILTATSKLIGLCFLLFGNLFTLQLIQLLSELSISYFSLFFSASISLNFSNCSSCSSFLLFSSSRSLFCSWLCCLCSTFRGYLLPDRVAFKQNSLSIIEIQNKWANLSYHINSNKLNLAVCPSTHLLPASQTFHVPLWFCQSCSTAFPLQKRAIHSWWTSQQCPNNVSH